MPDPTPAALPDARAQSNDAARNPLWLNVQQVHDDAMRYDWPVEEYRRSMIATLTPPASDATVPAGEVDIAAIVGEYFTNRFLMNRHADGVHKNAGRRSEAEPWLKARSALGIVGNMTASDAAASIRRLAAAAPKVASEAAMREALPIPNDIPQYEGGDITYLEGLAAYFDNYAKEKARERLPASRDLFNDTAKRLRQFDALLAALSLHPSPSGASDGGERKA